jgi:hypothetical protein
MPQLTFPTITQLRDYTNDNIVPNAMREISGEKHNNVANGYLDYIQKAVGNYDKVDLVTSGGVVTLVKPFTVLQTIVPDSVTWGDNFNNEWYIINATDEDIPVVGTSYYNGYLAPQTVIPSRSTIHIAKAENGAWLQMGGSGGSGGIGSIGLSMPDGFDVANSPLTSDGELEVTMSIEGLLYGTGVGLAAVTIDSPILFTDGTLSLLSNQAGGVPILDGSGKIPLSLIPASLLGAVIYQTTWNAATNSPALVSGVGIKGYYYIVSADGTTNLNGITDWKIGDYAIYDGTAWGKIDNTSTITGTGTTNRMIKWASSSTLTDSIMSDNGNALQIFSPVGINNIIIAHGDTNGGYTHTVENINSGAGAGAGTNYINNLGSIFQTRINSSTSPFGFDSALIRSTGAGGIFFVADNGPMVFSKSFTPGISEVARITDGGHFQVGVAAEQGYTGFINGTLGVTGAVRLSAYAGVGTRSLAVDANGDLVIGSGGGGISGSGTSGTIPVWSTSSALSNSVITQDGSYVNITGRGLNLLSSTGIVFEDPSAQNTIYMAGNTMYYRSNTSVHNFQAWGGGTIALLSDTSVQFVSQSGTGNRMLYTTSSGFMAPSVMTYDGTEFKVPGAATGPSASWGSALTQSFAVNNNWFGDNLFYTTAGTGWTVRSTGFGSAMYNNSSGWGLYMTDGSYTAGTAVVPQYNLLVNYDRTIDIPGYVGTGTRGLAVTPGGKIIEAPFFVTEDNTVAIGSDDFSDSTQLNINNSAGSYGFISFNEDGANKMRVGVGNDGVSSIFSQSEMLISANGVLTVSGSILHFQGVADFLNSLNVEGSLAITLDDTAHLQFNYNTDLSSSYISATDKLTIESANALDLTGTSISLFAPLIQSEGDIQFSTSAIGPVLRSPDDTLWRLTVDNAGALVITSV